MSKYQPSWCNAQVRSEPPHPPEISHSISAPFKALTAQRKVIDIPAVDRVIIIIVFGLVLSLVAISIFVAIAFPFLIAVVFETVFV